MSNRSNARVLVVDDCRDTADSLAQLLTLWGYDAEACYGGAEALEVTNTYRPDVVVLDLAMPGMDGLQVVVALREMPGMADATIIGLTGYSGEACQMSARAAGFDHCMVKPAESRVLRELLGGIAAPLEEFRRCGALTADGGRTRRKVFAS
jgi:CheY-like chemotaxis protein